MGVVQLCRHDAVISHRVTRPKKTTTVTQSLQWIQLTLGHVEIPELFGGLGLADSAGWLGSESIQHGLAPRHGLDHQGLAEPPAAEG